MMPLRSDFGISDRTVHRAWGLYAIVLVAFGCNQQSVTSVSGESVQNVANNSLSNPAATSNSESTGSDRKSENADNKAGIPADGGTASGTPPVSSPTNDRSVAKPAGKGEAIPINFDDLNLRMQADVVFRPWMMTDRAKELEGQKIRLTGYIYGGVERTEKIKEFVLLKNTECKFGPGGQADHLIKVAMQGDAVGHYTIRSVQVEGILVTDPYEGPDGNTWSVFRLDGVSFKEVKK